MAIPDYQSIMRPLLQLAADGPEHAVRRAYDVLADQFELTREERRELLPSGKQTTFTNRVAWARTYMVQAGLLEATRRAHFRITDRGHDVLASGVRVDADYLQQFDEFRAFKNRRRSTDESNGASVTATLLTPTSSAAAMQTPEEQLEDAHQTLQAELSAEVLSTIRACSPEFFERLVVDVLVRMGYGGSRREAGQAVGRSGDEGIDGIIKEDRLGLDAIYIQAKRWDAAVGRPEVQKFAGALQGARARKGIMITTSTFTAGATEYAKAIDTRIILLDGQRLAELMIEHDVGVTPVSRYEVKRLDQDYFVDE